MTRVRSFKGCVRSTISTAPLPSASMRDVTGSCDIIWCLLSMGAERLLEPLGSYFRVTLASITSGRSRCSSQSWIGARSPLLRTVIPSAPAARASVVSLTLAGIDLRASCASRRLLLALCPPLSRQQLGGGLLVRARAGGYEPLQCARYGPDIELHLIKCLVDVVHRERNDVGAVCMLPVSPLPHPAQPLGDLVALLLDGGQLEPPHQVVRNPQSRGLGT